MIWTSPPTVISPEFSSLSLIKHALLIAPILADRTIRRVDTRPLAMLYLESLAMLEISTTALDIIKDDGYEL
jgi:hypothetical protein